MSAPAKPAWDETLAGGRREVWVFLAYAVGLATASVLLYLGLRPGGMGPIYVYQVGRSVLFLVAAGLLLFGLCRSVLRRPVLQSGRLAAFGCLGTAVWFSAFPLAYPSSHEGHPSSVAFRLPFEAPATPGLAWTVRWGGGKGPESALVLRPDRRFGFDFVLCDAEGRSAGASEYFARGETILAPAAGVVVAVVDDEPDAPFRRYPESADPYGNHVVIEVAPDEYLVVLGLAQGSAVVGPGASIEAGTPLGVVGHSARTPLTPEAYIGVHLQDTPDLRRGEGIPFFFRDYVSGDRPVAKGTPLGGLRDGRHTGERVRPAPGAAAGAAQDG